MRREGVLPSDYTSCHLGRLASKIEPACEENYFFSSFLGLLHFSQVLPSFLALTQQGCSHSLPSFLALSQQESAALTSETLANRARAVTIAVMDFIVFVFLARDLHGTFVVLNSQPARSDSAPCPCGSVMSDYNERVWSDNIFWALPSEQLSSPATVCLRSPAVHQ